MTLEAWVVTDVGMVREHNEDAAYKGTDDGFFIVADGMGGHAAGEVASAMAVATVREILESKRDQIETFTVAPTDPGRRRIVQLLQDAVHSAHQAVFQRGTNEADKAGMGTTLDVVLIAGPEAFVAHVGDSRTYLIRDGRSSQITTDHTVAEVLVIEGKLTIEEAQVSPLRTILVNAIGVSADVGVEMAHVTLKRGDRLLLCSDGLHDYFPAEEEIAEKLSTSAPDVALRDMVELAKTRGGHDNITGVVVQIVGVAEPGSFAYDDEAQRHELARTNPFANDEPTETALIEELPLTTAGNIASSRTPPTLKATQPMRAIDDEGTADTIPPGDPVAVVKPPAQADAKPDAEAKSEAKPEAKPDAKTAADADAKASADPKPTASDLGSAETIDIKVEDVAPDASDAPAAPAAPAADIETADTGQIRLPKDAG